MDAGADPSVPGHGARLLWTQSTDDRIRLAGVYRRRELREDDGDRHRLRVGALGRRTGCDPRRQRAAVLESQNDGDVMKQGVRALAAGMFVALTWLAACGGRPAEK